MCPLGDRVSSGVLGALNLLSDPWALRFGNGHHLVCLRHSVSLGLCQ